MSIILNILNWKFFYESKENELPKWENFFTWNIYMQENLTLSLCDLWWDLKIKFLTWKSLYLQLLIHETMQLMSENAENVIV
jgi:hypothetical protein